jgi:hypothetical protein
MAVFWVVAPCGLVEVCGSFKGAWCLEHQGDRGKVTQKTATFTLAAMRTWNLLSNYCLFTRNNPRKSDTGICKTKYWTTLPYTFCECTEHRDFVNALICGTLHKLPILFIYFVQILGFHFLVVICTNTVHGIVSIFSQTKL